jgi:hypothetical protein
MVWNIVSGRNKVYRLNIYRIISVTFLSLGLLSLTGTPAVSSVVTRCAQYELSGNPPQCKEECTENGVLKKVTHYTEWVDGACAGTATDVAIFNIDEMFACVPCGVGGMPPCACGGPPEYTNRCFVLLKSSYPKISQDSICDAMKSWEDTADLKLGQHTTCSGVPIIRGSFSCVPKVP